MAMNNVEWTLENIKKAEKACKESQQTVVIKTIDVSVLGLSMEGYGVVLGEARIRKE